MKKNFLLSLVFVVLSTFAYAQQPGSGGTGVPQVGEIIFASSAGARPTCNARNVNRVVKKGYGNRGQEICSLMPNGSTYAWADPDPRFNLLNFGADPTGVLDSFAAMTAWHTAMTNGDIGLVPIGLFRYTQNFIITKKLTIEGLGEGSAFWADTGAGVDGFTVGNGTNNIYDITFRNLAFLNRGNVRDGLVLLRNHLSRYENIHLRGASRYEVYLRGCLINRYNFIISVNHTYPYTASNNSALGAIRLGPVLGGVNNNANIFDVILEVVGAFANGTNAVFHQEDQGTGAGNNTLTGTIEGSISSGRYIEVYGANSFKIRDLHLEGAGTDSGVLLSGGMNHDVDFYMTSAAGNFTSSVSGIKVAGYFNNALNFTGGFATLMPGLSANSITKSGGAIVTQAGPISLGAYPSISSVVKLSQQGLVDNFSILQNGDHSRYVSSLPAGYTKINGAETITQTGIGKGDTTQYQLPYATKIATTGATQGLVASLTAAGTVAYPGFAGKWVTFSCWVYLPSGTAPASVVAAIYQQPAGTTQYSSTTTVTNEWVQLTSTELISGTSADFRVQATASGTFYTSGWTITEGFAAPRFFTPPANQFSVRAQDGYTDSYAAAAPVSACAVGDRVWSSVRTGQDKVLGWTCTVSGTWRAFGQQGAGFGTYTADGVWGGTALPMGFVTPYSAASPMTFFGYQDGGSGQYIGSFGFGSSSVAYDGSLLTIQNRVHVGVPESFNRFQLSHNGQLAWGPGSGAVDVKLERDIAGRLQINSGVAGTLRDLILRELFIGSSSGTPTTNNFKFSGTATAARTISIPDASFTIAGSNVVNTFTVANTFSGVTTFNAQISANAVGGNLRIKADGTTALDGGIFATAGGDIYFANFDANRGYVNRATGLFQFISTSVAWGGITSSFPMLKRNGAGIDFRLADDSAYAVIAAKLAGTITNDSASIGNVGEHVFSLIPVGSAVSLTTATPTNITSISLNAGDWDVSGNVNFNIVGGTVTLTSAGIGIVSATLPTDGSETYSGSQLVTATTVDSITLPRKRISLAVTTTVYLVANQTFAVGASSGFGAITARRVR